MAQASQFLPEILFDAIPEAVLLQFIQKDGFSKFILANHAAAELYGYMQEELLQRDLTDLCAPETSENTRRPQLPRVPEDGPITYEATHIAKNGRRFPVEVTAKVIEYGGKKALLTTVRDITGRKTAEQIAIGSEAYFQMAFQASPAVMSITRLSDGRVIDINEAFCRATGYRREEVVGHSATEIDIWQEPREREKYIASLQRDGRVENLEVIFRAKDGRAIVSLLSSQIFLLNGEPHVLNIAKDITNLVEARQRVEASEARFREIFDASPNPITISRLSDRRFVDVNAAFSQLTGYSRQESIGKTAEELHLWVDESIWKDGPQTLQDHNGVSPTIEATFRHKNGQHLTALFSATVLDLGGEPHVLSLVQDITEIKRAQEKIRKNEYLLKEAQRIAHIGSWELNLKTNTLTWSDETHRIFEIAPGEFSGTYEAFLESIHPDDREAVNQAYTRSVQEKKPYAIEHRLLMPDGRIKWVKEQGETYYDDAGQPWRTIGTVLDITAHKEAERAINASETRFRHLFENSPVALFEVDITGLLSYFEELTSEGREITALWAGSQDEIITEALSRIHLLNANQAGLDLAEAANKEVLLGPLDRLFQDHPLETILEALKDNLMQIATNPALVESELSIYTLQGTPKDVYFRFVWQPAEQNPPRPAIVAITDITPLKKALQAQEEALRLARTIQQANQALASSLDLKTVLDTLLTYLENLVPYDSATVMLRQNATEFGILHTRKYERWTDPRKIAETVFDIRTKPHLQRIVEEQTSVLIKDTRKAAGWEKIPGTEHVISWLGIPLIVGGEVIALYSLDKAEPNFFTPEHLHLAESLGAQAATAIKNALLYEETSQRAQDFSTLYEASQALAGKTSLDVVFRDIIRYAYRLLGSTGITIYRYNPANQSIYVALSTHPDIHVGTRLALGEGMAGKVIQSRKPMRIDDYTAWEGRSPQYEGTAFGAVLEVPMLYREELIGVLSVYESSESSRKFTEEDERLLTLFATQAAAAIHSARLLEETRQRLLRIQTLRRIDRVIAGSIDINVTLNTVLDEVISQEGIQAASILLLEPNTLRLECLALRGFRRDALKDIPLRVGVGWPGKVVLERNVLSIPNIHQHVSKDPRLHLFLSEGVSAYRALPLIAKGKVQGVLEVFLRESLEEDEEWDEFLLALAGQVAIALDNSTLFRNLERANLQLSLAYDATIEGWSRALDLRDKETEGHTQRVTEMTLELARAVGLDGEALLHIRRGALLHDIGKMGVPDAILHKPGPLTREERAIIERHPQLAYDMLFPIEYLQPALDIPYSHHEKWDGSGYPRGLKGQEIPLAARIFAIVDVYDALTSDRPYRKAWPKAKALEYIREQAGKHFDPKLVSIFLASFG